MFDIEKIKNDILKIENRVYIRNRDFKEVEPFYNKPHLEIFRDSMLIFLDYKNLKIFHEIIDSIRKNKDVKKSFLKKEIREYLINILFDSFKVDETKREINILENLESLRNDLKEKIREWTFYTYVENLKIEDSFIIGDIEIINHSKFSKEFKELYSDETPEGYKQSVFDQIDFLKEYAIVKTTEKGSQKQFKRHVLKKIRLTLNLLNFYKNESELGVGLPGERTKPTRSHYFFTSSDFKSREWGLPHESTTQMDLNANRISEMYDSRFGEFSKLLSKRKKSEIERNILISIFWYGESVSLPQYRLKKEFYEDFGTMGNLEHFNLSKKFLYLFMALETLFNFYPDQPIIQNISERVSILLGKDFRQRNCIKKRIQYLYRIRNNIIHGSDTFVFKSDATNLEKILQSIIFKLMDIISSNSKIKSVDDLNILFEKVKLSGNYEYFID